MGKINYIEDMQKWEEEFRYFHLVKVRFSETDMFGHMNNSVAFVYFESARIQFLQSLGFMQEWIKSDSESIAVAADMQCDFLQQVYFDEEIKIYVKVQRVGTSSVDLHYMGKNQDGKICFVGRGTLVQVSKVTGKGVAWTEDMRTSLSEYEPIHTK